MRFKLAPAPGLLIMLFADIAHGYMRTIRTARAHPEKVDPTWLGDAIGHWEGDTLVVDALGFSDRT